VLLLWCSCVLVLLWLMCGGTCVVLRWSMILFVVAVVQLCVGAALVDVWMQVCGGVAVVVMV